MAVKMLRQCVVFFTIALVVMGPDPAEAQVLNQLPYFLPGSGDMARFSLPENTPIGSTVYQLKGVDPEGSKLIYSISGPIFSVDRDTGVIKLRQELDREMSKSVEVIISITDEGVFGTEPNTVSIRKEIPVRDFNDNMPQFFGRPYRATVKESSKVGYELQITPPIVVTDLDDGPNAECTITCTSAGHVCDTFKIDTIKIGSGNYTARVTLRKPLDFETQPSYVLTVTARDSGLGHYLSNQASISISVVDVQDQIPVFINAPYSATIEENSPPDTFIMNIVAQDGDTQNQRDIVLSLENERYGHFQLREISNGKSALFTTKNKLDREDAMILQNGGVYSFNITATEIMDGVLTRDYATTQVTIILTDVEDNLPIFNKNQFHITIPENLDVGTPLPGLMIVVSDLDMGSNSQYNLSLRNVENSEGLFSISPTTGMGRTPIIVKVLNNTAMDYELFGDNGKDFIFEIWATVHGKDVSSTRITVQLEDANDNAPEFSQASLNTEVNEDAPIGWKIADVSAIDKDSGRFSEISYILKGFGSENFYTDARTGGLFVKKKLDYEKQKSYSMTLVAVDGGQRETNLNVFVNVLDVNDNYPMFDSLEYTRTIREGAMAFEPQFFVHAVDIDGPSQGGGRLFYTIDSENSISGHEFTIDSETGEIKISNRVSSMDTERGQYELVVSARDYGEPPLSNNTRIVVRVGISGNQRPIFKNRNMFKPIDFPGPASYKVSVPENATPGENVTKITATDPDGIDALMEYKIIGANDNFEINAHSGLITLSPNAKFDRESLTDQYNVVVAAIDAGFPFPETATATVHISISDVNDEPPRFQHPYNTHISERTQVGSKILTVRAIDPDLNSNLSYSIVEPISASSKSGLKLKEFEFDYKNTMIMNSTSGEIILNMSINANTVSVIILTVKAEDLNADLATDNPQTTTTEVTIYIQSFREIDPIFKYPKWSSANPVIQRVIKEEIPIGQTILTLEAEDPENHERISYYKMLENPNNFLQLHEGTGELIVMQRLDYESLDAPYFNVTVQAINLENNRHSIAILNFTVLNVNDNDPIFTSKTYKASIEETARSPDRVVTVKANDADKILVAEDTEMGYGNVTYSISGQMSSHFVINATSGEISIAAKQMLDHELYTTLTFQVHAEDAPTQPNESRKTTADVIVTVLDVNDNVPTFDMKSYSAVIPENVPEKSLVIQIRAIDPDEGPGGEVHYDLFNEGDASGLFMIDRLTGKIYTKASLTGKGRADPYNVVIRAQDQGQLLPKQESLFNDTTLTIYIGDVSSNDGVPVIISPKLGQITNITENSPAKTPILQVIASDPDSPHSPSGTLNYRIQNNTDVAQMFSIDAKTGLIVSKTSLDREIKSNYSIIVVVSDNGIPPLAVSRVVAIQVLDVDDHRPHFNRDYSDGPLQYAIDEELTEGSQVAIINAIDEDIGSNAAIDYAIINGNQEGHFSIERGDDNSGIIKTQIPLDREKQGSYLMTIKCFKFNQSQPRMKPYNNQDLTEIQVLINVLDVDDHLPEFVPTLSDIGIRHNVGSDSLITTIHATDQDPTALGIAYRIVNISYTPQFYKRNIRAESLNNLFSLNNETGELRTANVVHDFVDGYFSLLVSAHNSEDPHRHRNDTLKVFIIRDKSMLRFVFTKPPIDVQTTIAKFSENLQRKLKPSALELHLFSPEAQVKSDLSLDFTSTSVCFQLSRHGSAIPPQQMEKLLHQPDLLANLTEVYVNYAVSAIEPCLARRILTASSWTNSAGVWLVLLAALIGIVALIATCVSCCVFKSRKDGHSQLMSSTPPPPPLALHHEGYMVSQPNLYGDSIYGPIN